MSGSPRGTTDEIAGMPDEILAAQRPAGAGIGAVRGRGARIGASLRLLLFLFWPVVALIGPLLATSDPNSQELADAMLPPAWLADGSSVHPLGTDQLGRDILLRVIYGAQSSLALGIIAVAGSATVGSLAGVAAAQGGMLADETIMRIADIQLSIPFFLLAIAALAIVGGSAVNMVIILVVSGWVPYARVVRSELQFIRDKEFITAARSIGARSLRIAWAYLLPATRNLIIVTATIKHARCRAAVGGAEFPGCPDCSRRRSVGEPCCPTDAITTTTAWWISTILPRSRR